MLIFYVFSDKQEEQASTAQDPAKKSSPVAETTANPWPHTPVSERGLPGPKL